jgi:hypothetical protein
VVKLFSHETSLVMQIDKWRRYHICNNSTDMISTGLVYYCFQFISVFIVQYRQQILSPWNRCDLYSHLCLLLFPIFLYHTVSTHITSRLPQLGCRAVLPIFDRGRCPSSPRRCPRQLRRGSVLCTRNDYVSAHARANVLMLARAYKERERKSPSSNDDDDLQQPLH